MLYVEFLKWVGKQGLKSKVLQKYLNKAWREAEKAGKPIIEKNFPSLLKKAQDFKANFKVFDPKIVKPIKVPEQTKNILNIKSTLGGRPVKIIRDKKTGKIYDEKVIGPAKVIYGRFPKKLPRKPKADGGSIDKSLPGRSRDI